MTTAQSFTTRRLDHLGIVAGICRKIQLVEMIDSCFPEENEDRLVSVGEATLALILNGLGFVNRPLYLTPEFFQNKPVSLLIREGLTPESFNDDSLGRALDILFEGGLTELFSYLASHALSVFGIAYNGMHLDSTSVSFYGAYLINGDSASSDSKTEKPTLEDGEPKPVHITYGHSKDMRPDLKQVVVSLITAHQSAIPIWIQILDGNTSDKKSFPEAIENYMEQLGSSKKNYFIMDSAFYTAENVKNNEDIYWISRVPETIKEAKFLLEETARNEMTPVEDLEGYSLKTSESTYGEVGQRWIVVFSEKAYEREEKTFEKKRKETRKKAENELKKLGKLEFACEEDGQKAVEKIVKKWKYHQAEVEIKSVMHFKGSGRPKKGAEAERITWKAEGKVVEKEEVVKKEREDLGKFIVTTNIPEEEKSSSDVLKEYKGQGKAVERGFRFLKDPMFFAKGIFLKKPSRIMALIMIMGLSLLVYSLAERELRKQLLEREETVPDQTGKETQQITMRRVFQIFEGIDELTLTGIGVPKRLILNLTELQQQILCLLGPEVQEYYFSSS